MAEIQVRDGKGRNEQCEIGHHVERKDALNKSIRSGSWLDVRELLRFYHHLRHLPAPNQNSAYGNAPHRSSRFVKMFAPICYREVVDKCVEETDMHRKLESFSNVRVAKLLRGLNEDKNPLQRIQEEDSER